MALEITDENFEELVFKSDKPALLLFWAEWAEASRILGPIIEEMANEYHDSAIIGKVNTDLYSNLCANYGIRDIPCVLYFKDGREVDKELRVVPKGALVAKLEAQL